jgi:hypothetical protein
MVSSHSGRETSLGKPRFMWKDNIKMNLIEIYRIGVEWSQVLLKGKKILEDIRVYRKIILK